MNLIASLPRSSDHQKTFKMTLTIASQKPFTLRTDNILFITFPVMLEVEGCLLGIS